jgi:hypothetical protein
MVRLVTLTALAAALTAYATEPAQAADPAPLVLVQTIPLKGVIGNLDHLAVDARGGRLFVANKANNTLDVVDLKAGTLVKQIPDQTKVSGVAYAGDLDMIFVGNGGGVCNGIDGKDYKTVFSTKAEKADNVYYHSGNKMVYVAHGETVSVLDAKTGAVKDRISTGGKTEEFRVDKKANKLFINLRSPSVVAVIDLGKNQVVDRFKLTKTETNGPLAYDDKAGLLFVGCGGKAPMIIAVDAKTGMELASVVIPGRHRQPALRQQAQPSVRLVRRRGGGRGREEGRQVRVDRQGRDPEEGEDLGLPLGFGPAVRRRAACGRHRSPPSPCVRGPAGDRGEAGHG